MKRLIDYLWKHNYRNIKIIDNNSTYPPLLDYYNSIEDRIKIFRLDKNYGYRVFWKKMNLFEKFTNGYFVLTDPDILPNQNCPSDFLKHFMKILDGNPEVKKVGFSLQIDDLPNENPLKKNIIEWEKKYWVKKNKNGDFIAEIDTTFALYRPGVKSVSYKAIRTNEPYMAKHLPWYRDEQQLTKNELYYQETAGSSNSWNINRLNQRYTK
ncbi:hypothetical protein GCM10023115_25610 [Pontixanthobacter gangjinensis]|uniref:Glycosyltransferase family 2 protein n=1 Tax=Christiangramia aestuarii TaxID=1028746 RepID=A0A7K1LLU0_9FLAO|nr:glycosyltransferase family 2 protein [Christiangramia aestuarii]MUP41796.1 glycosyltransferase family 2 protein [Christiangramia aestuarii]